MRLIIRCMMICPISPITSSSALIMCDRDSGQKACVRTRSVMGIQGLESESVKKIPDSDSDSYRRIQGEES